MPITPCIVENGYVVKQVVADPWTTDDLIRAGEFEKKHLDQASHSVHLLVDFSASRRMPPDILWLRREPSTKHPRVGYMVFVGTVGWLRLLMTISLRVMRFARFRFFETETDALTFLREEVTRQKASAGHVTTG
jgi:hypothetical protein